MYRTPSVMGSAHVNRMCGYVGDVLAMLASRLIQRGNIFRNERAFIKNRKRSLWNASSLCRYILYTSLILPPQETLRRWAEKFKQSLELSGPHTDFIGVAALGFQWYRNSSFWSSKKSSTADMISIGIGPHTAFHPNVLQRIGSRGTENSQMVPSQENIENVINCRSIMISSLVTHSMPLQPQTCVQEHWSWAPLHNTFGQIFFCHRPGELWQIFMQIAMENKNHARQFPEILP